MQYAESGNQFYPVYAAGSIFTVLVVFPILLTRRKQG